MSALLTDLADVIIGIDAIFQTSSFLLADHLEETVVVGLLVSTKVVRHDITDALSHLLRNLLRVLPVLEYGLPERVPFLVCPIGAVEGYCLLNIVTKACLVIVTIFVKGHHGKFLLGKGDL